MWCTARIMPSQDIHDLISINFEYVNLHGKKEFKIVDGTKFVNKFTLK